MSSAAGGQPTLEEVATRAGVGRGTVSRVINGSPQVSERTRSRVMRAVDELGYVPNMAARALVTRRSGAIALVISEPEERIFGEPFFAGVIRGITAVVGEASRQLVLALVQTREQVDRLDSYLTPPARRRRAHAVGRTTPTPCPPGCSAAACPSCSVAGRATWPASATSTSTTTGEPSTAVAHLVAQGRRRVAAICGPQDMIAGRDRLDGYRKALAAAGLEVDEAMVEEGDFSEVSGATAMRVLLERRPDVDAVFAASDLMALGAMRVLREAGRRVPQDVALVGFDDGPLAAVSDPPLTTVHQPMEQLGREMAQLLLAQIRDGVPDHSEQVVLDTSLVRRTSA